MHFDVDQIQLGIAIAGIVLSLATATLALLRDWRSLAYRAFALGMVALAAESALSLYAGGATWPGEAVAWAKWRLAASALVPGSWLLFSLSYSRQNYREFIKGWKWAILASFLLPILLVFLGGDRLFAGSKYAYETSNWLFLLGPAGYVFHVFLLLFSVLILVNLEKTLRTSYGAIRWQIKFSILGIGLVFAARVYTATETLLYSILDNQLFAVNSSVLVIANILLAVSALRNRARAADIYVSQDFLYSSLTLLASGFYLLVLGISVKLAIYLGLSEKLFQNGLFFLLALLGSAALLLSEHMRFKLRRFVHRHFRRPSYDYRKIWTDFTQKTASLSDTRHLCDAVARRVSETFQTSAVSVWLTDEDHGRVQLAGSTALPVGQAVNENREKGLALLAERMRAQQEPADLAGTEWELFAETVRDFLEDATIRFCAPLASGGEFVGFITMNEPTGGKFSIEDSDLLKTFADQAAVLILNHRLFESLGRARELQAFQALSAFFMHDLKNVASTLSLTLQNFPVHYDNPEFRADALKMIGNSRERIQKMCGQLSVLNQKFEIQKRECDLNEIVSSTLEGLNLNNKIVADLKPLPRAHLDPEQMQAVILNLVLNADQSMDGVHGQIRMETAHDGDHLVLTVTDNGCGMSPEFVRKDLFRPFKTTKDSGSGIGLYQSKMIVEAHGGRIDVQSQEACGSTISVFLPASL
ncbi:MAG: XrtA/PEP-CTERM system histidine kinase PrsK [Syntrophobacteraceae bacterium]